MEIVFILIIIGVVIYIVTRPNRNLNPRAFQNSQVKQTINNSYKYIPPSKSFQSSKEPRKPTLNYGSITLDFVKSNSVSDYIVCFPKRPILNNNNFYPITIVRWLQENNKQFDSQKPVVELRLDNYIAQGIILGLIGTLHIGKKAGDSILEGEELCRVSFYNQKISKQIESTYNNKLDLNNPVSYSTNKNFDDHSNNLLAGIKLLPIKIIYSESDETKNNQGYEYLFNIKDINYFGKNFENAIVKRWYFKNGDYVSSGAKINELLLDGIYLAFSYSKRSGFLEILKSENQSINTQDLIFKLLPIKLSENLKSLSETSVSIPVNQKQESKIDVKDSSYPNPENHSQNLLNGIKLLPIKINYSCKSVGNKDNEVFYYFLNIGEINYFGKHFEQIVIKKWLFKNDDYVSSGTKINELLLDNTYPAFGYADRSGYLKILHSESKKVNNTDILYRILPIKSSLISEPIINPINNVDYQTDEDIIEVDDYNTAILQSKPIENITESYLREFWLCLPYRNTNNFTNSIPFADKLTDEIYLYIIKIFKEYYAIKGSNILDSLELTPQRIYQIKRMRQNPFYYTSGDDYKFQSEFVNKFYRVHQIADSIIRMKYDLNDNLKYYLQVLEALRLNQYTDEIENKLIELQELVPDLDLDTEIVINKNYTTRWKSKFQRIKDSKDIINNKSNIIPELEALITFNQKNYSLRNIYFEASKLVCDIDIFKSVWYFALYKHISKNAGLNSRPLPTIIKKIIPKTDSDAYNKLEIIFSQEYKIKNKREIKRLYEDIEAILIKPKKKISINKNKIKSAEKEHERIKKKLEKFLTDEGTSTMENTIIVTKSTGINAIIEANDNSIKLTNLQIELIQEIIRNGNMIKENSAKEFGRKNNHPHNMLIDSINEAFFEKFDDNIIYEENSNFYLNSDYIEGINTIIIKNDKI